MSLAMRVFAMQSLIVCRIRTQGRHHLNPSVEQKALKPSLQKQVRQKQCARCLHPCICCAYSPIAHGHPRVPETMLIFGVAYNHNPCQCAQAGTASLHIFVDIRCCLKRIFSSCNLTLARLMAGLKNTLAIFARGLNSKQAIGQGNALLKRIDRQRFWY
jgi:hypothetical protein